MHFINYLKEHTCHILFGTYSLVIQHRKMHEHCCRMLIQRDAKKPLELKEISESALSLYLKGIILLRSKLSNTCWLSHRCHHGQRGQACDSGIVLVGQVGTRQIDKLWKTSRILFVSCKLRTIY